MGTISSHRGDGVALKALEAGEGGRPLLLVHGFTGAKEDFGDWIDAFAADGWWVVAPDLRGHGASEQPGEEAGYGLVTFADDLLALVEGIGWSTFSLLGHSMGGMVAQELALEAPERVERLVLMDTDHGPLEGVDAATVAIAVDVLRSQGLPALLDLIATLPAGERSPAEERLRAERPGFAEWADGKVHKVSGAMYAAMAQEMVGRPDRLPALEALPMPVLVVVGEQDRNFRNAADRMAQAIPGAELVVIPDAAHSPQFENPDAWWKAVSGFLGADHLVD